MTGNLNFKNGISVPAVGFGTWQLTGDTCVESVKTALETGYRHIDTADIYGNHKEVAKGIVASGVDRKELFLTTKIWRDFLKANDVEESVNRFTQELGTDYFDLVLIHWPNKDVNISETLNAMKKLQMAGYIKSLGVSNFTIPLMQEAIDTGMEIVTNQVEFHPSLNQKELKKFCHGHQIILTAYSPIAQGQDLEIEIIKRLAVKYNKTASQIILSWLLSKQMIIIPRSSNAERIKENFECTDFEMSSEDLGAIENVQMHNRIVRPDFGPFED